MRLLYAALLWLLIAQVPARALDAPSLDDATDGVTVVARSAKRLSAVEERAQAFTGVRCYRSRGTITALFVKMKRDIKVRFEPVRRGDTLTAVDTTLTDVAGGGKQWHGVLPLSAHGTLTPSEPKLINATNILFIDPVIRERLKAGGKPITVAGQLEADGVRRSATVTHRLVGTPAADGSVVVESVTENEDAGIALTTLSTIGKDGLPLHAETSGTVRKGPINVGVEIQLTREDEE